MFTVRDVTTPRGTQADTTTEEKQQKGPGQKNPSGTRTAKQHKFTNCNIFHANLSVFQSAGGGTLINEYFATCLSTVLCFQTQSFKRKCQCCLRFQSQFSYKKSLTFYLLKRGELLLVLQQDSANDKKVLLAGILNSSQMVHV